MRILTHPTTKNYNNKSDFLGNGRPKIWKESPACKDCIPKVKNFNSLTNHMENIQAEDLSPLLVNVIARALQQTNINTYNMRGLKDGRGGILLNV